MQQYHGSLLLAQDRPFHFKWVQLLCPDQPDTLSDETLYVSDAKTLRKLPKRAFQDHFFVFRANGSDISRYREFLNGILFDGAFSVGEVFNHLLRMFDRVRDLDNRITLAVGKKAGYVPIMDVAKEMFPGHPVVVVDSAYNIIAATHNQISGNDSVNQLLTHKYYGKDSLKKMADYGYFRGSEKFLDTVLVQLPNISGCPVLVRSYHENGVFYSFIACYFVDGGPSLLEQYLFNRLTDLMDIYLRETDFFYQTILRQQQVLHDLINDHSLSPEAIADNCKELWIPRTGNFCLGYTSSENESSISASHLSSQLHIWCDVQNYGVFQYGDAVLILFQDWSSGDYSDSLHFQDRWAEMVEMISGNQAKLGISLPFRDIADLPTAYEQAKTAVTIGQRLHPEETDFSYAQYYLYDMLDYYDQKIDLDTVYIQYLDALPGKSDERNSDLILLYNYIKTERNISATAKSAYMHRNSVIYRLQKIEDQLKLDLDDPEVRLHILLSFKILEMKQRLGQPDAHTDGRTPHRQQI